MHSALLILAQDSRVSVMRAKLGWVDRSLVFEGEDIFRWDKYLEFCHDETVALVLLLCVYPFPTLPLI
jgi:hypothetical protein